MKLNTIAFTVASITIYSAIILYISIHCLLTGFGKDFLLIFESLHPGFDIVKNLSNPEWTAGTKTIAVLINFLWAIADALIIGFVFSSIYNLTAGFIEKRQNKSITETTEKETDENEDTIIESTTEEDNNE